LKDKNIGVKTVDECLCCAAEQLVDLWELPNLPLTGIYLDSNSLTDFPFLYDQILRFCNNCTHMQLKYILDPTFLYRDTYSHETSKSPLSNASNINLLKVISEKFSQKSQILEIGCNDSFLLRGLQNVSENRAGIDPIYEDRKIEIEPGIFVHGGFIETIDLNNLLSNPIDLLISSHTFEHLENPILALLSLKPFLAKKFDVILEIPSSIRMVEQLRLDQVFHQHSSYYTPESLSNLFKIIDCNLVDISFNYSLWGGTQILHFSNYDRSSEIQRYKLTKKDILNSKALFQSEILSVQYKLQHAPGNVYAYGAAQMLPILGYHIGEQFTQIQEIFDDNPTRIGKFFPGDDREIRSFKEFHFTSDDTVLITALDSAKPLIQNLINKGLNLIILPLGNV
jgi:hypothetical protein